MVVLKNKFNWGYIDMTMNRKIINNILTSLENIRHEKFVTGKLWGNPTARDTLLNIKKGVLNPNPLGKVFFDSRKYLEDLKIMFNRREYYQSSVEQERHVINKYFNDNFGKKQKSFDIPVYIWEHEFRIRGKADLTNDQRIIEFKSIKGVKESANQLIIERGLLQLAFYKLAYPDLKTTLILIDKEAHIFSIDIDISTLEKVIQEFYKRLDRIYGILSYIDKNNFFSKEIKDMLKESAYPWFQF